MEQGDAVGKGLEQIRADRQKGTKPIRAIITSKLHYNRRGEGLEQIRTDHQKGMKLTSSSLTALKTHQLLSSRQLSHSADVTVMSSTPNCCTTAV